LRNLFFGLAGRAGCEPRNGGRLDLPEEDFPVRNGRAGPSARGLRGPGFPEAGFAVPGLPGLGLLKPDLPEAEKRGFAPNFLYGRKDAGREGRLSSKRVPGVADPLLD
jgi:hypothetical protein